MAERTLLRAIFKDFHSFEHALKSLKESEFNNYSAYGPTNLVELEPLMPKTGSGVRLIATVGAVIGLILFYIMAVESSQIYSLITGGKPPISRVPFVVVVYEGTILMGAIFAFIAVVTLARLWPGRKPHSCEYDKRFSGNEFGITVYCNVNRKGDVTKILKSAGAQEVKEC